MTKDRRWVVVFKSWKEFYAAMEASLDNLQYSYDSITTHPRKPGLGENPARDRYFSELNKVIADRRHVRFRRILTVTTEGKYEWIEDLLRLYHKSPNFNMAYFDQLGSYFPLVGMILFDKREVYLTVVFEPQAESIYIRVRFRAVVEFFAEYFDRLWAHNIATKIKLGNWISEPCLLDLQRRLGVETRSLQAIMTSEEALGAVVAEPYYRVHDSQQNSQTRLTLGVAQLNLVESDFTRSNGVLEIRQGIFESKIRGALGIATQNGCDCLCLPELSVRGDCVAELSAHAEQNQMLIIGGTYYAETGKNVCPIVLSNGNVLYGEKRNLSPYQIGIAQGKRPRKGDKSYFVKNSRLGSVGVMICADYMDGELRREVQSYRPDFVFVLALNGKSDEFFAIMNAAIIQCSRDLGSCPFIVYCNSIYEQVRRGERATLGDGRTSLWGFVGKLLLDKLRETGLKPNDAFDWKLAQLQGEGLLIAVVDLARARRGPRPHTIKDGGFEILDVRVENL